MSIKTICKNKRAGHDYQLIEKVEAGLVLQGSEVKSLRAGKASINESFISVDASEEAYIINMSIAPYSHGSYANHEERRKRKLLLHKKQILKIKQKIRAEGMTAIPLHLYFKDSRIKLEIALGRGKKEHDKRQDLAKRDADRKARSAMKNY